MVFGSYIVYELEHSVNSEFSSLGTTIWWSFITFTTIGYGDLSPVTTAGQIIAALFSLGGCVCFALPAGMIGTGLGLQVKENKRIKKVQ